ncbi:MAG TPA: L,D-transpeptidase [Albitalea sp.]|nr:L,D-transpeptidase [Albitalea sp.]
MPIARSTPTRTNPCLRSCVCRIAAVASLIAAAAPAPAALGVEAPPPRADFGRAAASQDTHRLADWIVAGADNVRQPFFIVDKRQARLYAFDAAGHLKGDAPVLLGLARGDETVPGIGERKLADIKPHERTTPAGRFIGEPGPNAHGDTVVWVDYDAAVSMHRVITSNPKERRLQRLATRTVADNRISYGCINVPAAFYDAMVLPVFQKADAVIYVMPDTRSLSATFGKLAAQVAAGGRPGPVRPEPASP